MIKNYNIFRFFILAMLLCLSGISNVYAAPQDYYPENEEEFDSMIKWENYMRDSRAASHACTDKIIWDSSELETTCMPSVLSKDGDSCDSGLGGVGASLGVAVGAALMTGGLLAGPGVLIAGVGYAVMTDICASSYVMAPYEVVNKWNDKKCVDSNGQVNFEAGSLTVTDMPYFFHCDPNYDPVTKTNINGVAGKEEWVGRTLGYAGGASAFCNDPRLASHRNNIKNSVNTVYMNVSTWLERNIRVGSWEPCYSGRTVEFTQITPGEDVYKFPANFSAYFRIHPSSGKVQICVAAPYTFLPIRVGCTTTAPPGDEVNIDPFLKAYVQGTRCAYLLKPREDLQSLGKAITGVLPSNPVKKFLASDMHITSTVVGCIKDMLLKIFIVSPDQQVTNGPRPFFQVFQERMKQIVMAALMLSLTFFGLKIMTAGQPPQKGEMIMYALKFAVVLYFGVGAGFYEVRDGEAQGLFPNLMQVPDELADIFLQAQNVNDPANYCRFPYRQGNILGEHDISITEFAGTIGTEGSTGMGFVKMTVWDLVDCKIVNYLTLGSCDYSLTGMLSAWFTSASLLASKIGIILGIVSFFYTFFVLVTMFKFAHIFILCMFTVTILIFLAPIFLLFLMFEPTKNIATKWFNWILAYLIYPALLFAFIALMLSTFDAIFYGNLSQSTSTNAGQINFRTACIGNESVFCKTQELIGYKNACAEGSITSSLVSQAKPIDGMSSFTGLKDEVAEAYFNAMLKMLLFAFLFYLFLGSVTDFMAIMLGVVGFGGMAKGIGSIVGPLASVGGAAGKMGAKAGATAAGGALGAAGGAAAAGAGKAAGAIRNKIKG